MIYGSIQVVIIILTQNINLFKSPWSLDYELPFQVVLSIICAFTLCITNYELEYYHRKTFYSRMESKLERNEFRDILQKLPEPLIMTQQSQIKWTNDAFHDIQKFDNNVETLFPTMNQILIGK